MDEYEVAERLEAMNDKINNLTRELEELKSNKEPLYCNFCGKDIDDVEHLILGIKAAICNECVELCSTILEEKEKEKERE